jgi:ribonuclease-3
LAKEFSLLKIESKIYKKIKVKINYEFKSIFLLVDAASHPSFNFKKKNDNFERLEFLGDRVLGIVVADFLYNNFIKESEGDLSQRLSVLVSGKTLLKVSHSIDLENILYLINNVRIEGKIANSILVDSLEALIGAIFLDGGFKKAKKFVINNWRMLILEYKNPPKDPKSLLQEWSMANSYKMPDYVNYSKIGPDHSPIFSVKVIIQDFGEASGKGTSKKLAEINAAENLYKKSNKYK